MRYEYGGKVHSIRPPRYVPFSRQEMAAKIAYFREAEEMINGGPWPIELLTGCGTNAGYLRHHKAKEPACDPCKAAHAQMERNRHNAWIAA